MIDMQNTCFSGASLLSATAAGNTGCMHSAVAQLAAELTHFRSYSLWDLLPNNVMSSNSLLKGCILMSDMLELSCR